MRGLFVTGTDTGVGKTWIACQLARELSLQGLRVIPRKPVESGCRPQGDELLPLDAQALLQAAAYPGPLSEVCPWRFADPVSPALASRRRQQPLNLDALIQACRPAPGQSGDLLLVEGAGGFYSPLCEDALNADLAQALKLPLLLVAEDRLGCISQALLCVEAARHRGLDIAAVVLNQLHAPENQAPSLENQQELQARLDMPVHSVTHSTGKLPHSLLHLIL